MGTLQVEAAASTESVDALVITSQVTVLSENGPPKANLEKPVRIQFVADFGKDIGKKHPFVVEPVYDSIKDAALRKLKPKKTMQEQFLVLRSSTGLREELRSDMNLKDVLYDGAVIELSANRPATTASTEIPAPPRGFALGTKLHDNEATVAPKLHEEVGEISVASLAASRHMSKYYVDDDVVALGLGEVDLASEDKDLQSACAPDSDFFSRLPKPKKGDWLSLLKETGQNFDNKKQPQDGFKYFASQVLQPPGGEDPRISLVLMGPGFEGDIGQRFLRHITSYCTAFFGIQTELHLEPHLPLTPTVATDLEIAMAAADKYAAYRGLESEWVYGLTDELLAASTSNQVLPILLEHGWEGAGFSGPPDRQALLKDLQNAAGEQTYDGKLYSSIDALQDSMSGFRSGDDWIAALAKRLAKSGTSEDMQTVLERHDWNGTEFRTPPDRQQLLLELQTLANTSSTCLIRTRKNINGDTQHNINDLFELLRRHRATHAVDNEWLMIGITLADIYSAASTKMAGNKFGKAAVKERIAVASLAMHSPLWSEGVPGGDAIAPGRLSSSMQVDWLLAFLRTVTHEACHLLGMRHCVYYQCLMSGSTGPGDSSGQELFLCPVCLRKFAFVHSGVLKGKYVVSDCYKNVLDVLQSLRDDFPSVDGVWHVWHVWRGFPQYTEFKIKGTRVTVEDLEGDFHQIDGAPGQFRMSIDGDTLTADLQANGTLRWNDGSIWHRSSSQSIDEIGEQTQPPELDIIISKLQRRLCHLGH